MPSNNTDMTHRGEKEMITVAIEPSDEVIERARQRAGADGDLEAHLLDQYVFGYEWVGVEELATNE